VSVNAEGTGAEMHAGQHHSHAHEAVDPGNEHRVLWALCLTGGFMVAEVIGGLLSGSLALLADAGHMLTDTAALGLSLYAFRMTRRPATPERSYGHARFQVMAAFINGATLIGISLWIFIEAVERILDPVEIIAIPMLVIASIGLLVNIAAYVILSGGSRENLNVRGAALHVLSDLLGSAAAISAALVILFTGWTPIDPVLSVVVAVLILRSAWLLVRQSWHVLMEGAPDWLDVPELRRSLTEAVPDVVDIHHVHAWSLVPDRPLITLHATVSRKADHDQVLYALQRLLAERFRIQHATIQIERETCTDRAQ
jgi:cobalt-zinc-cadmium efflux system protein